MAERKPKILIVDDEESIHLLYREELSDEGYEVISAMSGPEALELIEKEKPDLVVLDINMPGMNGLEVLRTIKEKNPKLPVILCSAYPEFKQDLSSWASDDYIVKSFDLTELKESIKRNLAKAKG
ncbi:MAG: response regulator [Thermodesulfobacteria bacterium]|nr:response regulator [Thermodesulfobacteriota bacterium]